MLYAPISAGVNDKLNEQEFPAATPLVAELAVELQEVGAPPNHTKEGLEEE